MGGVNPSDPTGNWNADNARSGLPLEPVPVEPKKPAPVARSTYGKKASAKKRARYVPPGRRKSSTFYRRPSQYKALSRRGGRRAGGRRTSGRRVSARRPRSSP